MIKLLFKLFKSTYTKHLNAKVEKYYNIYKFDMNPNHTSHNNEGDAFKHTYMSAEFTIWFGEKVANELGLLQEDLNPSNPPAERSMDLHNDEVGRKLGIEIKRKHNIIKLFFGADNIIAEKVMSAMNNGDLITHV